MRALALGLVMALPAAAAAADTAQALLAKMTEAVSALSYEGTFVFMRDDDMETLHIVHGHDADGVRERVISLTGEAREIIRDGDVLTCIWPSSELVVVESSRGRPGIPATLPEDPAELGTHYRLRLTGVDRIAGMACRNLRVKPRDRYRYGYAMCVAPDSGMLLKSVMFDESGTPIEKMMFTSIELAESIPAQRFEATMIEEGYTWHSVAARESANKARPDPGWRVRRMPPGFAITSNFKHPIAAARQPIQHMILSDGLASVSVFIAETPASSGSYAGATRSGALHAYAKGLHDHQVTVVGEVPKATVEMIGQSVVYQPRAQE